MHEEDQKQKKANQKAVYGYSHVQSHISAEIIEKSAGIVEVAIVGLVGISSLGFSGINSLPFLASASFGVLLSVNLLFLGLVFLFSYQLSSRYVKPIQELYIYFSRKNENAEDEEKLCAPEIASQLSNYYRNFRKKSLGGAFMEGLTFGMAPILVLMNMGSYGLILGVTIGLLVGSVRALKIYYADAMQGKALMDKEIAKLGAEVANGLEAALKTDSSAFDINLFIENWPCFADKAVLNDFLTCYYVYLKDKQGIGAGSYSKKAQAFSETYEKKLQDIQDLQKQKKVDEEVSTQEESEKKGISVIGTMKAIVAFILRLLASSYGFFEGFLVHGVCAFMFIMVVGDILSGQFTAISTGQDFLQSIFLSSSSTFVMASLVLAGFALFLFLAMGELPAQFYDASYMLKNFKEVLQVNGWRLKAFYLVIWFYYRIADLIATLFAPLFVPLLYIKDKAFGKGNKDNKKEKEKTYFKRAKSSALKVSKVLGNAIMLATLSLKLSIIFLSLDEAAFLISNLGYAVSANSVIGAIGLAGFGAALLTFIAYNFFNMLMPKQWEKSKNTTRGIFLSVNAVIGACVLLLPEILGAEFSAFLGINALALIVGLMIIKIQFSHDDKSAGEASGDKSYAFKRAQQGVGLGVTVLLIALPYLGISVLLTITFSLSTLAFVFGFKGGYQGLQQMEGKLAAYEALFIKDDTEGKSLAMRMIVSIRNHPLQSAEENFAKKKPEAEKAVSKDDELINSGSVVDSDNTEINTNHSTITASYTTTNNNTASSMTIDTTITVCDSYGSDFLNFPRGNSLNENTTMGTDESFYYDGNHSTTNRVHLGLLPPPLLDNSDEQDREDDFYGSQNSFQ